MTTNHKNRNNIFKSKGTRVRNNKSKTDTRAHQNKHNHRSKPHTPQDHLNLNPYMQGCNYIGKHGFDNTDNTSSDDNKNRANKSFKPGGRESGFSNRKTHGSRDNTKNAKRSYQSKERSTSFRGQRDSFDKVIIFLL